MLIDVRTKQEFDLSHADGAVNIPLNEIENGILPECALNDKVELYCRSGGRSERAKTILQNQGFTNVTNLGGLSNLKQS